MKTSKKVYGAIFNLCVATIMSTVMSLALTLLNAGAVPEFFSIWFESWLVSLLVSIPVTFMAIPLVGKILSFIEVEN